MNRRTLIALPPMLVPALLLASCGPTPPPPAVLDIALAAGADQNPDAGGRPAPVAVRIYFLAATAKFERADVFALTEREAATLGADSMGSEEFVLRPGESRALNRMPKPGVQFLGAVALFRDIDRARWRAFAPVAASGPTKLALATSGIRVTLAPAA